MKWLKIKKCVKRNWFPLLYKWVYFPIILSSLKPYVLESLSIWFPQINNIKLLFPNAAIIDKVPEDLIQWVTYFAIFFIYSYITFNIGKEDSVDSIERYRKNNKVFRSLTYTPKTLIFLFFFGTVGYLICYKIQAYLPREPIVLIILAILFGCFQYKLFKGTKNQNG